ncbi:MAG: hypothetical protein RJA19_425 [Bacteroidota bacterium]
MKTWVCALALGLLSTGGVGRARGQGAPCIDGWAAGYPCAGIDLLDRLTCPQMGTTATNDIWGWVDPQTGVEWALVGTVSGVAFVSIGPGGELTWRGTLPTHSTQSVWRDIKVYGSTMYVVSEAPGHGMQVFDLNRLRSGVGVQVWTADAWMPSPGNAHNLAVDAETGLLATAGGNVGSGGLLLYRLTNPLAPQLVGSIQESGYVHDAHIVRYHGPDAALQGRDLVFLATPSRWVCWDITAPDDPVWVAQGIHPLNAYTHQLWLTPDHRYLLVGDELDELQHGFSTRTLMWDVSDLSAPQLHVTHFGTTPATDHNQYVVGELSFQSNYRAGLQVLSLANIEAGEVEQVMAFDVVPESDAPGFAGSWSNYPFFPSGRVAVASMEGGVFLLQPRWLQVEVSAAEVCQTDVLPLSLTLHPGLQPPFSFSFPGLPPAAVVSGLPDGLSAPGTYTCEVSGLAGTVGPVAFAIELQSAAGTVARVPVAFEVTSGGVWLPDADGDGFGSVDQPVILCTPVPGFVPWSEQVGVDCNDADAATYPGAPEACDGRDNDCNGWLDDLPGAPLMPWYLDQDGDGYGGTGSPGPQAPPTGETGEFPPAFLASSAPAVFWACAQPPGYAALTGDCNDYVPWVYPGAPPTATGWDNNCDGTLTGNEWPPCTANFNQDMGVSSADLLIFLSGYGCQGNCVGDIDGNGFVASSDLLILLSQMGRMCGVL